MNNQVLFRLLEEIRLQCRWGRSAYDNVRSSLQEMNPEKTFFHVEALLTHACRVSRLLWPARASSKGRGDRLRQELRVVEDSPLNLRELRGRLEASDEQIEDWVAAQQSPSYVDFNIMPQGGIGPFKQDTFQRSLDPDIFKLVFRGEAWDLRRLADELHRIESAAHVWLRTHNPW